MFHFAGSLRSLKTHQPVPVFFPTAADVDECEFVMCDGTCINTLGSYDCHCDGRLGFHLAEDRQYCEKIPVCLDVHDYKHPHMLYLGEQFAGLPVIFLRFRLPENTKWESLKKHARIQMCVQIFSEDHRIFVCLHTVELIPELKMSQCS